jgi:archaellum component FlaC
MFDILKRVQADVSEVKIRLSGVEGQLGGVEGRLERVEKELLKHRRENAAMLMIFRSTVAGYEVRVSDLEEAVQDLKGRLT